MKPASPYRAGIEKMKFLMKFPGKKRKAACASFHLENSDTQDMCLYIEPEGQHFLLPPDKAVLVKIYGNPAVAMMHNMHDGKMAVSIWPDNGDYEIWYEGKDIWDWILADADAHIASRFPESV